MSRCENRSDHGSSSSGKVTKGANWTRSQQALVVLNVVLTFLLLLPTSLLLLFLHPRDASEPPCRPAGPVTSASAHASPLGTYCFSSTSSGCEGQGYFWEVKDNKTLCCGDFKRHVENFFKSELTSQLNADARKATRLTEVKKAISALRKDPSASNLRPAAHLAVLSKTGSTQPDGDPSVVQWQREGPTTFLKGLQHGGDRVTVSTAGYYYVYAGLQFDVDPATVGTLAIVAYLYKNYHKGEDKRKLMTARESSCDKTRDVPGPVSVHLAGVYKLLQGDEISVYADKEGVLNRSPAASYLGIYLI